MLPALLICMLLLLSSCAQTNTQPVKNKSATPASNQVAGLCNGAGETRNDITVSSLPAAQGNWPMFHGNVNRDGATTAGGGSLLTQAWTYCTGAIVFASPVVQNNILYIASTNDTITALALPAGKPLWQIQAEAGFYSSPVIQDGTLYAATNTGSIYAIDAHYGFVHWRVPLDVPGARLWSSPAVADGLLLIGAASTLSEHPKIAGQVLAFDAQTGKLRWRAYVEGSGISGGGVWSSPAVDIANNIVYVGTGDPDDGVEALDLQSGKLLWHWRSVVQDVADTDVGSGPLLFRDAKGQVRVVVGGKNGFLYCLDGATGTQLWQTHIADHIYSSPAYANGTLYAVGVLSGHQSMSVALDAQTGHVRWQHAIPLVVYASPALVGQTLYLAVGDSFVNGDGGVQVLNAKNGQLLQYMDLHSPVTSSPAVITAWLFVGGRNGLLYAFTR